MDISPKLQPKHLDFKDKVADCSTVHTSSCKQMGQWEIKSKHHPCLAIVCLSVYFSDKFGLNVLFDAVEGWDRFFFVFWLDAPQTEPIFCNDQNSFQFTNPTGFLSGEPELS